MEILPLIGGRKFKSARLLEVKSFPDNLLTKVSYSNQEMALKQLLAGPVDYCAIPRFGIDKTTFKENLNNIEFDSDRFFYRTPDNKLAFAEFGDDDKRLKAVFPEPDNPEFRKEAAMSYLAHKRNSNGYVNVHFTDMMAAIFGDNYETLVIEFSHIATESEIRTTIIQIWDESTTERSKCDSRYQFDSYSASIKYRIREQLYSMADNHTEMDKILAGFIDAQKEDFRKKIEQAEAEAELRKMNEIKNQPGYKEIPEQIFSRFKELGLIIKTNLRDMTLPGFKRMRGERIAAFSRWFINDLNGYSGLLKRNKELLKDRYQAKFFQNADSDFQAAWWHVSSDVDLADLYQMFN